MVKSVEFDVTGKSILPFPTLVQAIAAHQLVVDDDEFKKSVWAPAISLLIKNTSDAITQVIKRKSADEKFPIPDWEYGRRLGARVFGQVVAAELTTFSSYRLLTVKDVAPAVDMSNLQLVFTRSSDEDVEHWKRIYDYSIYNGRQRWAYFNGPLTEKVMYAPSNVGKDDNDSKTDDAEAKLILAQNDRCFNQFGKRYGITISESMHIQGQYDASLSLLKQFTSGH